jgi:hypothetical protein
MKISLILTTLFGWTAALSTVAEFELNQDVNSVGGDQLDLEADFWSMIVDNQVELGQLFDNQIDFSQFSKREVNTMLLLVQQIQDSGLIFDFLRSLNNNTVVIQYASLLSSLIPKSNSSNSSSTSSLLSTAQPYINQIWNLTQTSGLLQTTIQSLLFNDTNVKGIGIFTGNILSSPNNTWISHLLFELGNGADLTVSLINQLIKDNRAKVNQKLVLFKRDDEDDDIFTDELFARATTTDSNQGSSMLFLGNILSMFTNSSLMMEFFVALNQTDFITNFVLQFAQDPLAQLGVLNVVSLANATGIFNNLDLNKYFVMAKEEHILTHGTQFLLTSPVYEPRVAMIFNIWRDMGYFEKIRKNMYGPESRGGN